MGSIEVGGIEIGSSTSAGAAAGGDLSGTYPNPSLAQSTDAEEYWTVLNSTGSTITKGSVVYFSGISGSSVQITKAIATTYTTYPGRGVVAADIANGASGRVLLFGVLSDFDTSAFSVNNYLYVSSLTAGALTNLDIANHQFSQRIGRVITSHASTGSALFDFRNQKSPMDLKNRMVTIRHECMASTESGIASTVGGGGLNNIGSTGFGSTDMVNHPGIIATRVTTLTTDFAILGGGSAAILFGDGTWVAEDLIGIAILSDGTDTYTYRFGFLDSTTAADAVDGVYIEYNSASSANWIMCTANNSTRTKTPSSTAVVAAAWTMLKVRVVNGTSVEYFVNGVSIGTVTTNIPTTVGRQTGTKMQMVKVAGTTVRDIYHDFMEWNGVYNTDRF